VEALLKKSIAMDGTFPDAHVQLGNLYADQHEYQQSIPEYEHALELDPNCRTPTTGSGPTTFTQGKKTRRRRSSLSIRSFEQSIWPKMTRSGQRFNSLCIQQRAHRQAGPSYRVE